MAAAASSPSRPRPKALNSVPSRAVASVSMDCSTACPSAPALDASSHCFSSLAAVPCLLTSARSATPLVDGRPVVVSTVGVSGGDTMPRSVMVRCFLGALPSRPVASQRSHSSLGTLNSRSAGTSGSAPLLPGRPAYSS